LEDKLGEILKLVDFTNYFIRTKFSMWKIRILDNSKISIEFPSFLYFLFDLSDKNIHF